MRAVRNESRLNFSNVNILIQEFNKKTSDYERSKGDLLSYVVKAIKDYEYRYKKEVKGLITTIEIIAKKSVNEREIFKREGVLSRIIIPWDVNQLVDGKTYFELFINNETNELQLITENGSTLELITFYIVTQSSIEKYGIRRNEINQNSKWKGNLASLKFKFTINKKRVRRVR